MDMSLTCLIQVGSAQTAAASMRLYEVYVYTYKYIYVYVVYICVCIYIPACYRVHVRLQMHAKYCHGFWEQVAHTFGKSDFRHQLYS